MNPLQILIESLRSMAANRLRTALTMLGIIIGITSVMLMLALGESMQRFIAKELQALGTNMVYVFPGADRTAERRSREGKAAALTLADARALNELPSLIGAAPALQSSLKISAGNESLNSVVLGVTPTMFTIRNWKIDQGDLFSEADVNASARLVVIGRKIADQFFYRQDPIGQYLRIENVAFQVVGVLAGEGRQIDGTDLSEQVLVPITSASANLSKSAFPQHVHYIAAQGRADVALTDAVADMSDVLRDRHRIRFDDPDDFRVQNMNAIADSAKKIVTGVSLLLGLIGAISLVVGGIGIMNIMLVSVTERTREIGIRMAIGARPGHVLLQFLAEAVAICLAGGVIGILLAAGGVSLITKFAEFEVMLTLQGVLIACGFASGVGVFFGFYPARRASRLLPVECLRHE